MTIKQTLTSIAIAGAMVLGLGSKILSASPVQWTTTAGGNGHYYERVTHSLITWDESKIAAESSSYLGITGHLATIHSDAEDSFIVNSLGGSVGNYWLGGFQAEGSQEPDGGWYWITGEPWSYTNWYASTGEPNNGAGGYTENALTYWGPGLGWNDYPNWSTNEGYIVEYVPEPSTLGLLAAGGLAGLLARNKRRK